MINRNGRIILLCTLTRRHLLLLHTRTHTLSQRERKRIFLPFPAFFNFFVCFRPFQTCTYIRTYTHAHNKSISEKRIYVLFKLNWLLKSVKDFRLHVYRVPLLPLRPTTLLCRKSECLTTCVCVCEWVHIRFLLM